VGVLPVSRSLAATRPWFARIWPNPVVPLRPIWPGFALDTAFYGTLAFLLWSAPRFVKRTRRRRRGLCVVCGYDLRGMQKCPECGL
jgi:hypothetical protein